MARELAYFEDLAGTSRVYIDDIQPGYAISAVMPFEYAERTDSGLGVYDAGPSYDYIESTITLNMTSERLGQLTSFFHTYMKAGAVKFKAPSSWGMYLFGPAFPSDTEFEVKVEDYEERGLLNSPYLYHQVRMTLVTKSLSLMVDPAFTDCVEAGTLTIAGIPNIRFPQKFFDPEHVYEYYTTKTYGGEVYQIDRTRGSEKKYTSFELYTGDEVGGKLIYQLMKNTRSGDFILQVPRNSYPFGYESGDDSGFLVKLSDNTIKMQHNRYKDWSISLSLIKIS